MAGILTKAQFREELQSQVGLSSSSPVYTPARIDRWFYNVYLHITMPNVYKHQELETTEYVALSATDRFSLVNTYRSTYSIALVEEAYTASPAATSRRYRLRPRNARAFDGTQKQTRRPQEYVHWNRKLELDAVPDATWATYMFQVRGYILPPDLGDAGVTLLSADWDEVIQAGMRHKFWLAKGEEDKIEFSREDYTRLINERVEFLVMSSDDFHVGAIEMDSQSVDWRGTD